MVLNYIWVAFFVVAFIVALCKLLFMGDTDIFTELVNSTFDSSKTAFEISLGLTGILSLWLGIMKIGENSGMINALSRWLNPVFCRLFPEIPKGHPAMGSIFMNLSANMLGLDNAATPMGLKAMKELHRYQPDDYVSCNEHVRTDTDTRQHHDVPLANRRRTAYGHFHSHTDYDRYLYYCRCSRRQHCTTDKPTEQTYSYSDRLHQPVLFRTYLLIYSNKPRRNGDLLHAGCQHHTLFHHPSFYLVGIMEED